MVCPQCGAEVGSGDERCQRCGSAVSGDWIPWAAERRAPTSASLRRQTRDLVPAFKRSLTAEFRSFTLDSPYQAVPTPVHVTAVPSEQVPRVAVQRRQTAEPPRVTAPERSSADAPFTPLRPSETLWLVDGLLTHLFEEELATVPGRRFLHVKLMDGDEERYYRTYGAGYWDEVAPLCTEPLPEKGRRICIFHRPTDSLPGFPFMNFGLELGLAGGARLDGAPRAIRVLFRMKYYHSGRDDELRRAIEYTKPIELARALAVELCAQVGRPLETSGTLLRVLERVAAGQAGLLERVIDYLESVREAAEEGRVPLATQLYSAILAIQLSERESRFMVADSLGLLPGLVETDIDAVGENGRDGFRFKRASARMAVLAR